MTFGGITIRLNSNKKLAGSVVFTAGKVYIQATLMTFSLVAATDYTIFDNISKLYRNI